MKTYYSEWDPYAVEWITNLTAAQVINPGKIDDRSIDDVRADDLIGFGRAHFFAGIGGWDLALDLAGWDHSRPVWTASCPCTPYSLAGKRRGDADERNLWPVLRQLVGQRHPPTIFGEQVSSPDGRLWFAGVRSDLESMGYAVGGSDLCAAGVGSPNIRQRLYFAAVLPGGLAYAADADGRPGIGGEETGIGPDGIRRERSGFRGDAGRMADASVEGLALRRVLAGDSGEKLQAAQRAGHPGGANPWGIFDIIPMLDGKHRRIEPGSFPLAHGIPRRVGHLFPGFSSLGGHAKRNRKGRLKGYGNAINPELAAEFIRAFLEAERK